MAGLFYRSSGDDNKNKFSTIYTAFNLFVISKV